MISEVIYVKIYMSKNAHKGAIETLVTKDRMCEVLSNF